MDDKLVQMRDVDEILARVFGYAENEGEETAVIKINDELKKIPAVDAVEVVRCRDCAVPHNEKTGCPKLLGFVTMPDFFCMFGVRGEEHDK